MTSSDYTPGTRPAVGDRVRIEAEGVVGIVRGGDEPRYFVRLDEEDEGDWFAAEFFDVTVLAAALPPEPAIWSVVLDADGNSYQHIPQTHRGNVVPHFTWQTPGSTGFFSWKQLNEQYGPIYLIHDAGVSADPARVRAPGNSEETRPGVAAVPVTPEPVMEPCDWRCAGGAPHSHPVTPETPGERAEYVIGKQAHRADEAEARLAAQEPLVAAALAWREENGLAAMSQWKLTREMCAAVDAYRLQVQGEPIESLLTREMFTAEALEMADVVKARTTGPHPYSGSRRKDHAGAKCIRCGFGPAHANHKMTALDEEVQGEPETAAVSVHCNGCGTSHHPNVIGVACRRGYGEPEPMLVFTEEQMREWDKHRADSVPTETPLATHGFIANPGDPRCQVRNVEEWGHPLCGLPASHPVHDGEARQG